jgi:hypothetical protein
MNNHRPPGGPHYPFYNRNSFHADGPIEQRTRDHTHPIHGPHVTLTPSYHVNIPENFYEGGNDEYTRLDFDVKDALINAYHAWKRNDFKETKRFLNDNVWRSGRMTRKNLHIVLGIVNEFVVIGDDCKNFKLFITRNLPKGLQSCAAPETNHEHLCALLESIHTRITALENKL